MDRHFHEIPLVQGLSKTVDAGLHLDYLFPEPKSYHSVPEGVKPLFSVSYDEIDLNGIEKVYKSAKDEVLPLRNFLVGRKKAQNKHKSAFSVYGVIDGNNEVIYCLNVESILVQKLQQALVSPILSVKMSVGGLDPECVVQIKEICGFNNAMTKFNLDWGTNVTKEELEEIVSSTETGGSITFDLEVDIEGRVGETVKIAPKIDPMMCCSRLYNLPDSSKDVTIVASNKQEIKVHKCILMAQSSAFLSMLKPATAMSEANSGRILMEENSAEGIAMFVRCLYGFDVPVETISPDLALELFQLSHKYGVAELEHVMKDFLARKDVEWYTVDSLLEMYFFVKNLPNEDLAEHALIEMSKLTKNSLTSSDYFQKLELQRVKDLLLELWDWK